MWFTIFRLSADVPLNIRRKLQEGGVEARTQLDTGRAARIVV
jgi:hypothetical protein